MGLGSLFRRYRSIQGYFDQDAIPLYYFDYKPNFGDEIGPFIVSQVSGRKIYNVRDLPWNANHAYCTVGSLLHSLNKSNCIVWGSGFICDPQDQAPKHRPVEIRALRGPISVDYARKLGWGDCTAQGDPGLLMPDYLPKPAGPSRGKALLIPHYQLYHLHRSNLPGFDVVFPWEGLLKMAPLIASAPLVVSSSLHGVILAEAYRTPWIWWRQTGDFRKGGELKFLDFFESLNMHSPSFVFDDFYDKLAPEAVAEMGCLGDAAMLHRIVAGLKTSMPEFLPDRTSV